MDDFLPRAARLLQPHLGEEHRAALLALAFHGSKREILDGISQRGSSSDFTVRCVSQLLDRGCVGARHALSLLLEVVRADGGDELQASFQTLIDELDHRCAAVPTAGGADTGLRAGLAAEMIVWRFTGGSHLAGSDEMAEPEDARPHARLASFDAFATMAPDLMRHP